MQVNDFGTGALVPNCEVTLIGRRPTADPLFRAPVLAKSPVRNAVAPMPVTPSDPPARTMPAPAAA